MKWGVQHVKVTLENDSGETVVIEQSPDGRVKCEPGKQGKSERAANTAPPKAAESRTEAKAAAAPKAAKPKGGRRSDAAPKAEEAPKTAEPPKGRAQAKARGKGPRKGSLKWAPVKDHEYDGFAAPSSGGQFKALIAKDSQWALFYELKGTWPKHIGCFRKVDKAKERAQELHDTGWPETEFGPITAGQVARACPAPAGESEDETEDAMQTKPKAEEKPTEPQPEPKGGTKTDAERDKELMGSFSSELESVLDEDEDD